MWAIKVLLSVLLPSCTANLSGVAGLHIEELGGPGSVSLSQLETRMEVYCSIYAWTWEQLPVELESSSNINLNKKVAVRSQFMQQNLNHKHGH